MREIKFRAFDNGKMVYWPNYAVTFWGNLMIDNTPDKWEVKTGTAIPPIMQYTGLKDKNGVEIYEGDIVNLEYNGGRAFGAIEWTHNNASFGIKHGEWYEMLNGIKHIEVIGNIYQNPELLTPPPIKKEAEEES